MSWTAWVYAAGNPPDDGQIIALSNNTSGWQFKTSPDTGVRTFGVAVSGGSGHTQRYSKTVVSLNTWYHVAGVYNAAAKTLDIYVNGVLDNGVLSGAVPGSQVTPAINATVGKREGGFYFNGIIDNLRVYTRALSAADVQADMKAPISSGSGGAVVPTLSSIQCAPATIASGGSSKCTVALSAAAPTGGMSVALSDNNGALTVPGSVTVPAGSSSAAFTATAGSVSSTQSVTVTASLNGKSTNTSVTITPPAAPAVTVTSVQCAPGTIASGASSKCTVALSAAAPSGGSSVAVSDNNAALSVPGSVTVPAGSSLTTFTATAVSVKSTQSVTITAALNGKSVTTVLTIQPSSSDAGLAAAYAFDEGSGSTVSDASGNGNTGQIRSAGWSTTGRFGKALAFNGTSSYVDLGNPPSLQSTGSMTWSAWVYATGNPPDDGQIVAHSTDAAGWQFKTTPDTGVRTFGVSVTGAPGSRAQRYSKTVLQLNKWYYVAGVYNAAAKTLDIYVNGVLDNGVLRGTVPSSQVLSNSNTIIGRRAGGFFFKGLIDNLRIYNRALTAAEIQATMSAAVTKTSGGALAAAAQTEGLSAAPVRKSSPVGATAVARNRMHSGNSVLACSPRLIHAGGTTTCEIKGVAAAAPLQIAVNSTSEQVKVPAAVVSRPNQNSLTFQVSVDEAAARQSATIAATLGDATITDTVHVLPGDGPVLTAPRRQIAKPGAPVSFTVKAVDSTGAPVQITAKPVPSGASFDAATGRFDWTPAPSQLGSYAVTFTATNATGQSSSAQVTIDVDSGKPSLEQTQLACSPHAIATLEGKWLAPDGAALTDPSGASTTLGGTQVVVNGEHVPVLSASPTGVTFLCPALNAGTSLSIAVETPAGATNAITATMRNASPSIFSVNVSGQTQGSVSFPSSSDLAMARNFQIPAHPAQPGDHVLIWVTGLGQTPDRNGISVAFGDITVNADEIQPVSGYAGVYMVGATVPPGVKFSDAVPVHITVMGGDGRQVDSNTVTAAIEPVR